MANFINEYSAPCMLGRMAKHVAHKNSLFTWSVGKRNHLVVLNNGTLAKPDLDYLSTLDSFNFHYLFQPNVDILKQSFSSVSTHKITSIVLKIDELDFAGKKGKKFRNYINRYKEYDIRDQLGSMGEVEEMLDRWRETLGDKYFRDFSGKNFYFFQNNYHKECENVFIYDKDKLISFGVASPVKGGHCSYIIGKALAHDYPGLSEFTDIKLYEKLLRTGPFEINMGMAQTGLKYYKKKFPGSFEQESYNGKVVV